VLRNSQFVFRNETCFEWQMKCLYRSCRSCWLVTCKMQYSKLVAKSSAT